jgi:hypothetical protein
MAAFWVAALPRRVRLFAVSPTADLAGRTSCDTLRADNRQRALPCEHHAPAFLLPGAGLSHFNLTPVTSLRFSTILELNQRPSPFKGDALPTELIRFLHRERDLWLRRLLAYPMPLAACLSLAGTGPNFKMPLRCCQRTALSCESDYVHYPLPSRLADWY